MSGTKLGAIFEVIGGGARCVREILLRSTHAALASGDAKDQPSSMRYCAPSFLPPVFLLAPCRLRRHLPCSLRRCHTALCSLGPARTMFFAYATSLQHGSPLSPLRTPAQAATREWRAVNQACPFCFPSPPSQVSHRPFLIGCILSVALVAEWGLERMEDGGKRPDTRGGEPNTREGEPTRAVARRAGALGSLASAGANKVRRFSSFCGPLIAPGVAGVAVAAAAWLLLPPLLLQPSLLLSPLLDWRCACRSRPMIASGGPLVVRVEV
jgi:hypothetical protein